MELLTRNELAIRWSMSKRTIDRLRQSGNIGWMDLTSGKGKRPIVRFRLSDVEQYEEKTCLNIELS